ncbi:hypothetical protein EIN_048160 [Entamoeba invadens IP1]|uniref:Ubiquilin-1 n=2 Tax=Entamoeba invadens TaxID=33085 RepID=A0A0A1UDG1_ENTIV|nr:hypothetical protein EIN_048160 [Entamoeba invadens IP1]ELP94483.1 hypothetical protein EIN_048160 [Entamoeba invadens IP1]BAN40299.1 hypothetical protein, conserved [Entamoeba invadens]BAN41528.1 hypothetical protein, conserved [Entamoeba invadens]|eukprot:XP_004261254.1 hypothetical protein EIN_048160 [Entamoeba invadens IP1]
MKLLFSNVTSTVTEQLDLEECVLQKITILEIHRLLAERLQSSATDITLIYRGYKLEDSSVFSTIRYQEGSKIIFVVKKKEKSTPPPQAVTTEKKEKMSILQEVLNECDDQPDYDPTFIRALFESGPYKEYLKEHPEVEEVINNPKELKNIMKTISNPDLMTQTLRNTDNVISQMENIPGGHNQLLTIMNGMDPLESMTKSNVKFNPDATNEMFMMDKPLQKPINIFEEKTNNDFNNMFGMDFMFGNNFANNQQNNLLPRQQQPLIANTTETPLQPQTVQLQQRFSYQNQCLKEMGFLNEEENLRALTQTNGDMGSAIDILANKMN